MTAVTHILDDLEWRGVVADTTDRAALRAALDAGPVTFYCGFDPTAPSLHFGNLVQLVTMRRLQRAGHRPLGLVGGATGLIGDPSGRTSERVLNESEVVEGWVTRIRVQVERFLSFEGDNAAVVVNNLDWTRSLSAVDFLRDVGKHFSVNRMLAREAVAARLAAGGISYTEFSYQILQSLDFLELNRRHGCTLQTGGSDQWGNITAGVDLVRRVTGAHVHALSTQLLLKADGTKFGKTAEGAVWLDPTMTSPYAFHQYLLNADDADVSRLLRVFSFRSHEEIQDLEAEVADRPAARAAQRALADELTTLVHGPGETARAVAAARAVFGQGDLADVEPATLDAALATAPHATAGPGDTYADLFAAVGLVPSKSAARRAVAEGGAYVNNRRLTDAEAVPGPADYLHGTWVVLRRGKRAIGGVRRALPPGLS
jgi:tyrosyl-tRNA synthetase